MDKIKLGDKVSSKVSGFTGTVTAYCTYLYGEDRCEVTSKVTEKGDDFRNWLAVQELETAE